MKFKSNLGFFLFLWLIQPLFLHGQSINNPIQTGKVASEPKVIESMVLSNGYTIIQENESFGIINKNGKSVVPAIYPAIGWSDKTHTLIKDHIGYQNNDKWGIINLKNQKLSSPQFTSLQPFVDGLIVASKRQEGTVRKNFGIINTNEKVIVSFQYNLMEAAGNRVIASKNTEKGSFFGLLDEKEKIVIPFTYKKINSLKNQQFSVSRDGKKFALYSDLGVQLSEFKYDFIIPFTNGYHKILINGKTGILDINGKEIINTEFKEVRENRHDGFDALPFSKWDLLTRQNKKVTVMHYDTVSKVNKRLLKVVLNEQEYIVDLDDQPILPLSNRQFGPFKEGYSIVHQDGKYGVVNYDKIIIPVENVKILRYDNYFAVKKQVSTHFEWSVYDGSGVRLNKISYDQIDGFSHRFFGVKKNGLWGYMNEFGHEVISAQFDSVYHFKFGLSKVKKGNKFGIIDRFGRSIIPIKYDNAEIVNENTFLLKSHFSNLIHKRDQGEIYQSYYELYAEKGFIIEKNNSGLYGLFDGAGQRILKTEYDYLVPGFFDRLHVFGLEGKRGILTLDGGKLMGLEENLEEVGLVSEKLIGIKLNKKYGFIDFDGKLRIANRYDSIGRFSDERAQINLLHKWGYIDIIERFRVQPKYDHAEPYVDGVAIVANKNNFGLIDKDGNEILKLIYSKIRRNSHGNYVTHIAGKMGLVDKQGYEVIYPKYDSIVDLGNGDYIVSQQGKSGVIDENGRTSIPLIYDTLLYDAEYALYFGQQKADWINLNK